MGQRFQTQLNIGTGVQSQIGSELSTLDILGTDFQSFQQTLLIYQSLHPQVIDKEGYVKSCVMEDLLTFVVLEEFLQ